MKNPSFSFNRLTLFQSLRTLHCMNLLAVSLASSELSALTAPALPASCTTLLLALSSASKAPRATVPPRTDPWEAETCCWWVAALRGSVPLASKGSFGEESLLRTKWVGLAGAGSRQAVDVYYQVVFLGFRGGTEEACPLDIDLVTYMRTRDGFPFLHSLLALRQGSSFSPS